MNSPPFPPTADMKSINPGSTVFGGKLQHCGTVKEDAEHSNVPMNWKVAFLIKWLGQNAHIQKVEGSNPVVNLMDVNDAS